MADKRESNRIKEQAKVMDEAMRKRRIKKQLERLKMDNYHEDPHANLSMHRKAPKFEETINEKQKTTRNKKIKVDRLRRKNYLVLLEEDSVNWSKDEINYLTAKVPPSKYPDRHFCAVCGFPSNYTCTICGSRYCCSKCLNTHKDTRCLKSVV